MAIRNSVTQNEKEKFVEALDSDGVGTGKPAIIVTNEDGTPLGQPRAAGGFLGGTKTVTTAGTAVALAASTPCKSVLIQADEDNTGKIYIGGTDVDSTTQNGVLLRAEDVVSIEVGNLSKIFVDSSVSGEKVNYVYTT